jgi:hypothetical protein
LNDYLEKMAWKDDAGPCMQQEPPWDTKPNRKVAPTKGKDSTRGNQEQEGETTLDLDETGVLCGGVVTNTGENPDCTGEDEAVQEMAVESTDYEDSDHELEACASAGLNHNWEEFATVAWVLEGQLLYQHQCIGMRDGGICGRMFVNHALAGLKLNYTNTEYHPTAARPAWGCKKCRRAMCDPCKGNYVLNEKFQSPGRNSGVGNNQANRRCLTGHDKT